MTSSRGLLSALLIAGAGCSSVRYSTDYDPEVDFSTFRSWAWDPRQRSTAGPPALPPHWSTHDLQRVRHAVERELTGRDYEPAPEAGADFLVEVELIVRRRLDAAPATGGFGVGMGFGGASVHGSAGMPPAAREVDEGVIVIEFHQARPARRPGWRGVVELPFEGGETPEERELRLHEAVRELLSRFPPK